LLSKIVFLHTWQHVLKLLESICLCIFLHLWETNQLSVYHVL